MSVQLNALGIPAGVPTPRADKHGNVSAASVNAAAALRDYRLNPRLDYGTITGVNGPLVILDNVKVRVGRGGKPGGARRARAPARARRGSRLTLHPAPRPSSPPPPPRTPFTARSSR